MEPEKHPFEKENSSSRHHFLGLQVNFPGYTLSEVKEKQSIGELPRCHITPKRCFFVREKNIQIPSSKFTLVTFFKFNFFCGPSLLLPTPPDTRLPGSIETSEGFFLKEIVISPPGVIQAVTFSSPIVGGHGETPRKKGHFSLNHPKKVTKNCQAGLSSYFLFGRGFKH